MKLNQVAAQLYTIRDFIKTPAEIAESMRKLREIGYTAVQVSSMGPIPEEDLVEILKNEGLTCCATHEPADTILENPDAVVERLKKLDCKYTAYPYPAGIDFSDRKAVSELAAKLDRAGAVLREAGQVLTYHNHAIEFQKHDGKPALEIIYGETDPANLQGEIDTYWVQYGGCDPAKWCRRLKDRLPLLHLKDYMIRNDGTHGMTEIGAGTLDFPEIIAAAEEGGCEWFIIEQDTCPGDPFDSLKKSFDYVAAHLVR